jgi:hypothetical protein
VDAQVTKLQKTSDNAGKVRQYEFTPRNSGVSYQGGYELRGDYATNVGGQPPDTVRVRYLVDDPNYNCPEDEVGVHTTCNISAGLAGLLALICLAFSAAGLAAWVWLYSSTPAFVVVGRLKCLRNLDIRDLDSTVTTWQATYAFHPISFMTPTTRSKTDLVTCPACGKLVCFDVSSQSGFLLGLLVIGPSLGGSFLAFVTFLVHCFFPWLKDTNYWSPMFAMIVWGILIVLYCGCVVSEIRAIHKCAVTRLLTQYVTLKDKNAENNTRRTTAQRGVFVHDVENIPG